MDGWTTGEWIDDGWMGARRMEHHDAAAYAYAYAGPALLLLFRMLLVHY